MNHMPDRELTYELFAGLEKTKFRILLDERNRVELELVEVLALRPGGGKSASSARKPEGFSLTFQGPGDRLLQQRTYAFEHEKIGRFVLFIVPLGREGGAFQYQAIFNCFRKPA